MSAVRTMCADGCGYEAAHCGCDLPANITRRQLQQRDRPHQQLTEAAQALVDSVTYSVIEGGRVNMIKIGDLQRLLTAQSAGTPGEPALTLAAVLKALDDLRHERTMTIRRPVTWRGALDELEQRLLSTFGAPPAPGEPKETR